MTFQIAFACLCVLSVTIGISMQILGTTFVRVGTPPERPFTVLAGDPDFMRASGIFVKERALIVDSGATLINAGNLFIYASVIASLAVSFPNAYALGFTLFCLAVGVPLWRLLADMRTFIEVRERQQDLFDQIALARKERLDVLNKRPDFGFWHDRATSFISKGWHTMVWTWAAFQRYSRSPD